MVKTLAALFLCAIASSVFPRHAKSQSPSENDRPLWTQRIDCPLRPIRVPIVLDGKTGWALIDTGASYTVVGRELARGLKDSGHRRIVTTNSGRQELPVFEIDSFSFAGITCDSIKHIACADIAELQRKSGLSIDAIIGMDVLSEFALHIDCSLGILQVYRSGIEVRHAADSIDITMSESGRPLVKAVALESGEHHEVLIDTGCEFTGTVDTDWLLTRLKTGEFIGTRIEVQVFGIDGKIVPVEPVYFKNFRIGPYEHKSLVFYPDDYSSIGLDYLSRFGVVLDFPKRKMYVAKSNLFAVRDRHDRSGIIAVTRPDGSLVVTDVVRNSIASSAGIRQGDRIVGVNGLPLNEIPKQDVWRLLEKCNSRPLGIIVIREASTISVILP